MKIEQNDNEEASFQMAPMIDMVFLLLVFFMCASTMSQRQNIEMTIPEASKAVVPKERPERYVVNIQANGTLYEGANQCELETLKNNVKAKLAEAPKTKVYLRADKDAPHKEIKKVMRAMAEAGVSDFIFGVHMPSAAVKPVPAAGK